MAERVGTEFNRIGEWERGATDCRFSTLLRIAEGLDIEPAEIVARFQRVMAGQAKGK